MWNTALKAGLCGSVMALAVLVGGCALVADLVNPNVLAALGIDTSTLRGSPGTVLVTLNNQSNFAATFSVAVSESSSNPEQNFFVLRGEEVQSREIRSLVVDCPVGSLAPAGSDGVAILPAEAVLVIVEDGVVAVPYAGAVLQAGDEFNCGDVIEIRLVQFGSGATPDNFALLVRVIKS